MAKNKSQAALEVVTSDLSRPLTKSHFKSAFECPTKLFYTGNKDYGNSKNDDTFLKALAAGGFQVGELAKLYFPGGQEVVRRAYLAAVEETKVLLSQDSATIYEGAFAFENLFIRADIVVKDKGTLHLYEVKSKSWSPSKDTFWNKDKSALLANGLEYVYDVAYQWYVVSSAFPDLHVIPYLYLANKDVTATVDGLNQKFVLHQKKDGGHYVKIDPTLALGQLGEKILVAVDVRDEVKAVIEGSDREESSEIRGGKKFGEWVNFLAASQVVGQKISPPLSSECKKCEFRIVKEEYPGLKSGFDECWKESLKLKDSEVNRARVFELWDNKKSDALMEQKIYFLDQLTEDDIAPVKSAPTDEPGLTRLQRQLKQIELYKNKERQPYIDKEGIKAIMNEWVYPLHFIDFETCMVAVPFNQGLHPYEQIAFQFSHHTVLENQTVEHKGQWLSREKGKFPNFEFVRALKKELEGDNGTILRYATHENTVLNQIHTQLKASNEIDREELCGWIETITHSSNGKKPGWKGNRDMVDMLDLVKKYYIHPLMGGSNSIKVVLPAALNSSKTLKEKYGKPIYGKNGQIKSLNFENRVWMKEGKMGLIEDPYASLPKVFGDTDLAAFVAYAERFVKDDELREGGAAMMAYAKMQFMEMTEEEKKTIEDALLRYCELDTLAMVMIYEYFRNG